jgi:kumamolisin
VRLEDSAPPRPAGAERVDDVDTSQQVTVTVAVRGRDATGFAAHLRALDQGPAAERRHLTRAELADRYGADPDELDRVAAFYRDQGLEVVEQSAARRCVVVRGSCDALAAAFQIRFGTYRAELGTYRGHEDPVSVPAELADVITAVLGLEDRPQARPCFVANPDADVAGFTPRQVGQIYDFPRGGGADQTIGIIELGGGYTDADLEQFFDNAHLPVPQVTAVSVDGATNSPTGGGGADGEVTLDIEVAGAIAPEAKIAVYFAPNTDRGFYDAVTTAVHDENNNPSAISISWGSAEATWSSQAMRQMEQALADAAAIGVTITAAAGDSGSSDGIDDGLAHVDFPASAPHVLGCGGTTLTAHETTLESEQVWNAEGDGATGGGISAQFPVPDYQDGADIPASVNPGGAGGRGVPDVAGDADPATGYEIVVAGTIRVVGGTSAVAPLWAGLTAVFNEALGRPVGFINPLLYPLLATASFHQITTGNNGAYRAGPGWNPCCGLGTPDGANMLTALRGPTASST